MFYYIKRQVINNIDNLVCNGLYEVYFFIVLVYIFLVGLQGGVCRYWVIDSLFNSWVIRCLCCGSCDWLVSLLEDSQVDRENFES